MTRSLHALWLALLVLCLGGSAPPVAHATVDPGGAGPYPVATQDYNYGLAAYQPPDLVSATYPVAPNELDGRVYYPKGIDDKTSPVPSGPMPLIVFVHGRHGTSYSLSTGQSTSGWPPPAGSAQIPSYQGYDYEGALLASWGYVVVSIGVNGINFFDNSTNDRGMLARAELIQKSLDMWKTLSTTGGASLATTYGVPDPFGAKFVGKVDMANIGTMGHSRGGEGVMAHVVYNAKQASPYPIKCVFAIAPVDYNRYVVNNIPIGVIAPYCDGDVADNQGVHFFDDARYAVPGDPAPKYFWTVMGANHDFYNTIWDPNYFPPGAADDWGANGSAIDPFAGPTIPGNHRLNSVQQQGTGIALMTSFFRAHLGNAAVPTTTQFLPFLKGDAPPPPSAMTTELFETYHAPDTTATRLDVNRFLGAASLTTNTAGGATIATGLSPFVIAGGGPYPFTTSGGSSTGFSAPPTLANFALPTQPSARQPGDTPALYAPNVGGLSQLELGWSRPGASLENDLPAGRRDVSGFGVVSFRTAVNFTDYRNYLAQDDFDVLLTDGSGNSAYTPVSAWSNALMYPPGKIYRLPKVVLNGVRIPLSAFPGVNLHDIRSVTLVFDRQPMGALLLTDLAFAN